MTTAQSTSRRTARRLRAAVLTAGLLTAGLLTTGAPNVAEAGSGDCPTTRFCTWTNSGYPSSPSKTYSGSGNAALRYKSRFNGTYSSKTLISTQANGAGTTTCIPPRHGYSFGSTQYHNFYLITAGYTC